MLHTQTKVPAIKPFLKSADKLDFETAYTYRLKKRKWLGFFGALKVETPLLAGFLVKEKDTKLKIIELDGKVDLTKTALGQKAFELTSGFAPLILRQALGVSILPKDTKKLRIDIKIGGGFIQAFTQEGLRVDDDAATADLLELKRIQDYLQAGVEARIAISGRLFKKSLSYSLVVGAMLPFYSSVTKVGDKEYSIPELLNFDLSLKIGIQVLKWLAVNYSLNLTQAPLIQPKLQVTNNLVLSVTWSIL